MKDLKKMNQYKTIIRYVLTKCFKTNGTHQSTNSTIHNVPVPLEQSFQLSFSHRMTPFTDKFLLCYIKGLDNTIC